ncbi:MAG: arginine N-succinyltransferase, partial [Pirellulales bacterium]|nr:arginine N-succinyltransferase [Pirellulales bacterium]
MWTVRAVRIDDLDALHELVQSATRGLTSLQLDRARLLDRVEQSNFAFSRTGMSPRGEPYVLVLANDVTGELVGTSTIYAKTGGYQPLYAYRLVESDHHSELLSVHHHRTILELQRIHDGPTEIGSLFLRGKYRGQGRGRWLSLSRFALIAMLRHRFADRVIAEMRGKARPDGSVPFWEAVAGRFIPTDFATVDTMSTVSKQFIEEMMPQHPVYLDLLPEEIRTGIGQVHDETVPALRLLQSEGFQQTDLVDIFD